MEESTFPLIPGRHIVPETTDSDGMKSYTFINSERPLSTARTAGKYPILHKIRDKPPPQPMTLEGDESRFTKFYPLPAIGCSTPKQTSLEERQDDEQQRNYSSNYSTPDSIGSPVQSSIHSLDDLPLPSQSPPMTSSSNESREAEDSDDHLYLPWEKSAFDLCHDEDNETATDILFHKVDIEDTAQFCKENRICERPKTSYAEQSRPISSQPTVRRLIRSNTYDILPTVQEEDTMEEHLIDNLTSVSLNNNLNSSVSDNSQRQQVPSRDILLCIQTSKDDHNYTYGYFKQSDSLQHVLNFVGKMQHCNFGKCRLRHENETKEIFTDLSQTISKVRLKHRSVLTILTDSDN